MDALSMAGFDASAAVAKMQFPHEVCRTRARKES